MKNVCVLDYGSGNVKSVFNLFSAIAEHVVISNNSEEIRKATHIVLPGGKTVSQDLLPKYTMTIETGQVGEVKLLEGVS